MKPDSLDLYINQRLKQPGFKKAWELSEPQYQITRALMSERLIQKLSQRDLAHRAKTTQAVISRVESMAVNPSLELLNKLAQALGKQIRISLD